MAWIPITYYAIKNSVSISTLRRRIKSGEVSARLENGKYLIEDANLSDDDVENLISFDGDKSPTHLQHIEGLIAELKKAYSQVLSEKEEQIGQLKTIIRFLEQERGRSIDRDLV